MFSTVSQTSSILTYWLQWISYTETLSFFPFCRNPVPLRESFCCARIWRFIPPTASLPRTMRGTWWSSCASSTLTRSVSDTLRLLTFAVRSLTLWRCSKRTESGFSRSGQRHVVLIQFSWEDGRRRWTSNRSSIWNFNLVPVVNMITEFSSNPSFPQPFSG